MKSLCAPQTAVVIFVTKYETARFAYAWEPFGKMVVSITRTLASVLATDLDRVMAHETAHLFGAADEYDCSPFTLHGVQSVPNGNCAPANPFATACLMRGNADVMCNFTRGHLGWFGLA